MQINRSTFAGFFLLAGIEIEQYTECASIYLHDDFLFDD